MYEINLENNFQLQNILLINYKICQLIFFYKKTFKLQKIL